MATEYFKTCFRNMFDKGGVLAVGLVCLYFQRKRYLSDVFGPISYGIISIGTLAVSRHILMDLNLSDNSKDIADQTWDRLLKEMLEKSEKMRKERRKREILQSLHKILTRKVKGKRLGRQTGKDLDIFSQEFLQHCEKEMKLNPEERDLLEQYLKSFEVDLKADNPQQSNGEKSDDPDMEIINKEEIQTISGVE